MRRLKAIPIFVLVAGAVVSAVAPHDQRDAVTHVLNRLGYGPRPGDVERVSAMGIERYIESQLRPESVSDAAIETRLAAFETLALDSEEVADRYFTPPEARDTMRRRQEQMRPARRPRATAEPRRRAAIPLLELSQQKVLRAVYSDRQLEEVLVDFWFNHFNVFSGKGQFARFYLTEYERDAIRPHVLGRFRDLLGATAKSPAMLWYLDNWVSAAPDTPAGLGGRRPGARGRAGQGRGSAAMTPPQRPPRGLNENYARELLELHTLGVDGGYTQDDVVDVARAMTGWTIEAPRRGGGSFVFRPAMHDNGDKTVLGTQLPADGGQRDGERVLDIIAAHPATARHIARKLAMRFVSDTPPQALVDRAARVFTGTGGDLRAVTRVILTSPEFLSTEARRAKIKTPFEFVVSAVRATGADVRNAAALVRELRELGMPLYGAQPPTGYSESGETWINAGTLLARLNFASALVNNQLPGTRLETRGGPGPQALVLQLGSPEFQKR